MAHHAYFVTGDIEEGVAAALNYGVQELGLLADKNPDVMVFRHGLFSVDDARDLGEVVSRMPLAGDKKLVVIAASRLFHEAQNALLKVFEEPAPGTTLILVLPSEGNLIATLRSRLIELPGVGTEVVPELARAFLKGGSAEREKIVGKLLDRAKSDKAEEKQAARAEALILAGALMQAAAGKPRTPETMAFLADLDRFMPVLHERSAPLKLIFEHLLITIPAKL